IKNYPDSALLPNAYYWLGELYMVKNLTQEAERVFNSVVEQYPKSRKTPDARYKLGLVYARYGQQDKARKQMESVKSFHPDSTAAKLADQFLESTAK
ncbi:tol-pal system protein YbgF, partial [Oceanospirillum linum]